MKWGATLRDSLGARKQTMPTPKKKKIKLAIFDIDGTIFRSSLLTELVSRFVEGGIFKAAAKKEIEVAYLAWRNRKGNYENYINAVIRVHLKYLPGVSAAAAERIAGQIITREKDRVYRFTRDLLLRLAKQGYYLIAISGSPDYIVKKFTTNFGFDAAFGAVFEVKRGRFTGRVLKDNSWHDKSIVLRQFLAEKGIAANFKKSLAVGDTPSDIPILKLVGTPIAFNPNHELAERARREKWRIVVERKDVIYGLNDLSFL